MTHGIHHGTRNQPYNRLRAFFSPARHGERGVTTIEFALIAPVFLYLLFGIIEVSLLLFTSSVVEGGAQTAARKIRTGAAQLSGDTEGTFTTELCSAISSMYDCNDVSVNVSTFSTFSGVSIPDVKINGNGDLVYEDGDGNDDNDMLFATEFTPGGASEISVVHVIYSWEFYTPLIGALMSDNGTSISLSTTVVFRNEPYE